MQSDESGSTALPGGPWGRGAAAAPCTLPGAGSFPAHIPPEPCRAAGWGWIADLWDGSVPEAASTHCTRAVLRAAGPGSRHRSFAFLLEGEAAVEPAGVQGAARSQASGCMQDARGVKGENRLLLRGAGHWDVEWACPSQTAHSGTGSAAGGRQNCGLVRMQPSDLRSPSDG